MLSRVICCIASPLTTKDVHNFVPLGTCAVCTYFIYEGSVVRALLDSIDNPTLSQWRQLLTSAPKYKLACRFK